MSLIKQLWIAIAVLMILAFLGSLATSTQTARSYFEEQLRLKNIDNANTLALTLSQMEKDPVLLELLIAAQFDTGHYRRIELVDPLGSTLQLKTQDAPDRSSIPDWFSRLAPLHVEPGVAQVQDGWRQFGTVYLESTSQFAREALWTTTKELFFWLLGVAILCGLVGSLILKRITRPLDSVVHQAEAIGERRFITSSEPKTLEFAKVVRSMNILSGRIRHTLEMEGSRLEEMRRQSQLDKLTGLANREHFLDILDALLQHEDRESTHALVLLRIQNLAEINRNIGYRSTDDLLGEIAMTLRNTAKDHADTYTESHIARTKGSEFVLLLSEATDIHALSADLCRRFDDLAREYPPRVRLALPHAASYFKAGEQRSSLLIRMDNLLAVAEQNEQTCSEVSIFQEHDTIFRNQDEWRAALSQVISDNQVQARKFPVLAMNGTLLHHEAMMRLFLAGRLRSAGSFLPWAKRLGMLPKMDLAMASWAISELREAALSEDIAVNLSLEALRDTGVRRQLLKLLEKNPEQAQRLWIESPERLVIVHLDVYLDFCTTTKSLGCKVGLENAGAGFTGINRLQEVGLDYLKIDRALVHDIANNGNNQNLLRGLCILGHSIGLTMIAEGVRTDAEIGTLRQLGVDGITGPGVTKA
ncbi:MAG: EAL domain-containing protein [Desulfovibrionales bacterium]|nr:MAG: EAL domain-containing protein [Desulfovibrionales bacterium]